MSDDETEIEIEKVSLGDEGERSDSRHGRRSKRRRSRLGGVKGALVRLVRELLRIVVGEAVGKEFDRLSERYTRLARRLRRLHVLGLIFLGLGILTQLVVIFAGVVWLSDNYPAIGDPMVFVAGAVVGYLVAVVAGLVYMR